jgi:hypothetical protein
MVASIVPVQLPLVPMPREETEWEGYDHYSYQDTLYIESSISGGQASGKWASKWQVDKQVARGQASGTWASKWQVDKQVASAQHTSFC